jgi:hypothetical protein
VREVYPEQDLHKGLEKAIRSYTVELQHENKSESKIYELLDEMNPVLGNLLTFYEEFVMKYDESYKNAAKVQKKVAKEVATVSSRALTEITNKRKHHELEQATHNKQSKTSELTTQSIKMQANQGLLDITPGTYVGVEPVYDYHPSVLPETTTTTLPSDQTNCANNAGAASRETSCSWRRC